MKKINRLLLLLAFLTAASACTHAYTFNIDWDCWKSWVYFNQNKPKKTQEYEYKNPVAFNPDTASSSTTEPISKKFDYDEIAKNEGITLYPADSIYLKGTNEKIAARLEATFLRSPQKGLDYFMSLERHWPENAIAIFDQYLSEDIQWYILMKAPSLFIGKILYEMKTFHFKDQELLRKGNFELTSQYSGKLSFQSATIPGELIPLGYIFFILQYSPAKTKEEEKYRQDRVLEILHGLIDENLVDFVIYKKEHFLIKRGDNHPSCVGKIKELGYCEELMKLESLPIVDFIKIVLMSVNNTKVQIAILEGLYKADKENAIELINILEKEAPEMLKVLLHDLSDELRNEVSEDIFAYDISNIKQITNDIDQQILLIGSGDSHVLQLEASKAEVHTNPENNNSLKQVKK